jgi:hypothetical protein
VGAGRRPAPLFRFFMDFNPQPVQRRHLKETI